MESDKKRRNCDNCGGEAKYVSKLFHTLVCDECYKKLAAQAENVSALKCVLNDFAQIEK